MQVFNMLLFHVIFDSHTLDLSNIYQLNIYRLNRGTIDNQEDKTFSYESCSPCMSKLSIRIVSLYDQ